jgi:hypothetical protein
MSVNLLTRANNVSEILIGLDIPRVPAEIVAFLLINNPEGVTSADIQEALSVSKASVSSALDYLEALELIAFRPIRGSRQRLIFLKPSQIANYLKRRMFFFGELTNSLKGIAKEHKTSEFKKEIESVVDLCNKLDNAVNDIIHQWEGNHHEKL